MSKKNELIKVTDIQNRIFTLRNVQVMIDRDLSELYQVPVKRLNEQVKRNNKRFPEKFCFQLNDAEKKELVANCDRLKSFKHSSVNPYAFTKQGFFYDEKLYTLCRELSWLGNCFNNQKGYTLCSQLSCLKDTVVLINSEQIFVLKYQLVLPTEEELRAELESEIHLIEEQQGRDGI